MISNQHGTENRIATRVAAVAGLLAVALGAFGAHGLKGILLEHHAVEIWEKAVFYHFIHAVMLFILAKHNPFLRGASIAFTTGIIIFSGSLYVLAITNLKWLGAITPIGGISLIVGWALLFCSARQRDSK